MYRADYRYPTSEAPRAGSLIGGRGLSPRRFRCGGEKGAAGVCRGRGDPGWDLWRLNAVSWLSECIRGPCWSAMTMEAGEWAHKLSAIESFEDGGEGGFAALPHPADTRVRGRAWSKPTEQIGEAHHEVSKPAK